jgi:DNA-binding response OmpR family regulator
MAQPAARILVVDDERFFREAIGDALTAAGMDCVLASTGAEALEQAMDEGIGVLLLDVQLPDLSGIEVLRRLRETRPRLRVIIVSSHTDQEYVLDALRLGASDYLAKPIHDEELVLAVRRALQDHDVASRWDRLRGRLGALEYHVSQLTDMGRSCHGHEGRALLRDYAARAAAEILEAARTSIMLLDDAKGVLRVAAAVGEKVPIRDMDVVPVGEQVAGVVFARGEPLVVGDITQEHRVAVAAPEGRYATKSFAITPLRSGERSLGVLCATDRPGGDSFDETDLALLRILSLQVSRLLDDLDRMEAEAADSDALGLSEGTGIADGDAELARSICAALHSEIDPERILSRTLAAASGALGDAPVSLFLLDAETGELRAEALRDAGRRPDRPRLAVGSGLTGTVLETGRPMSVDDPEADPRFESAVDTPEDGRPGPFLCVPLCFRGKGLGVFRAFPSRSIPAATAEVLAAALSAAVRNVLLYRGLLEAIDGLARARREASGVPAR